MTEVSNRKLCAGENEAATEDVGSYYRTTFPVAKNGTRYSFRVPCDFGFGGMSIIDGKIVKQEEQDIWDGGKSEKLNFEIVLNESMHILELYGGEKCCDGTTKWSFSVNDGDWLDFTVENLNKF